MKLIGEGRNHKVFSDGLGKVFRVSKIVWDEKIWEYEEAFYNTIL